MVHPSRKISRLSRGTVCFAVLAGVFGIFSPLRFTAAEPSIPHRGSFAPRVTVGPIEAVSVPALAVEGATGNEASTTCGVVERRGADCCSGSGRARRAASKSAGSGPGLFAEGVSDSGRYVVFVSQASDLVAGYTPPENPVDVYVRDTTLGQTTLVSHASGSTTTSSSSGAELPSMSGDGNYVAYLSRSTDLVAGQTDAAGSPDVFLYDRAANSSILVSRTSASATTAGNGLSGNPSTSADGRYTVFESFAGDLVAGYVGGAQLAQVFLFDRVTGTTVLVSHAAGSLTTGGDGNALEPTISADGRFVVYESLSSNLVAGMNDANEGPDIFLYNRTTGTNTLVSRSAANPLATANDISFFAVVTGDGGFVAFNTLATNLVSGVSDSNDDGDVYLFERATGTMTLVSRSTASATTTANDSSSDPSLSSNGNLIAFTSFADDVVGGQMDPNYSADVFLFNRTTGTTTLVSRSTASATTAGNGDSFEGRITPAGDLVAFQSEASDLAPGQTDTNNEEDVFAYDVADATTALVSYSTASATTAGNGWSGCAFLSGDGSSIVFTSLSDDLVGDDFNSSPDVFRAVLSDEQETEFPGLFVADTQNHRVQRFDGITWTVVVGNGSPGTAPNRCNLPKAVTASADGQRIYVSDTGNNRVTYSTDGGETWAVFAPPGTGLGQVRGPQGIRLDAADNLYVVDALNERVLRFNGGTPGTGVVLASSGTTAGRVKGPRGLAVDSAFNLYVSDRVIHRILRVANAHQTTTPNTGVTVVTRQGLNLSQVNGPEGLAMDAAGNLYVADTLNERVIRFPNGTVPGVVMSDGAGTAVGRVTRPEGVTVTQFPAGQLAGQEFLVVSDTMNNRIQGRPLANPTWQLIGTPNGVGSRVGQFRIPSQIK